MSGLGAFPVIGDIVQYVDLNAANCAAIVIHIMGIDGRKLWLRVLGPGTHDYEEHWVRQDQDNTRETWHWPERSEPADQDERARAKPEPVDAWADLSTDELLAICHERGWEMTMIRDSDVWRVRRACCDGQFLGATLPDAIRRCMYESARWEAAR